jgi:hypothetical protein
VEIGRWILNRIFWNTLYSNAASQSSGNLQDFIVFMRNPGTPNLVTIRWSWNLLIWATPTFPLSFWAYLWFQASDGANFSEMYLSVSLHFAYTRFAYTHIAYHRFAYTHFAYIHFAYNHFAYSPFRLHPFCLHLFSTQNVCRQNGH